MKMFTSVPEVFLYRDFVDFRKSINGLSLIVEQQMQLSPLTGSVFVFCNKGRDKLKVLYWDRTGFALWYKRLEKDKFKWCSGQLILATVLYSFQYLNSDSFGLKPAL